MSREASCVLRPSRYHLPFAKACHFHKWQAAVTHALLFQRQVLSLQKVENGWPVAPPRAPRALEPGSLSEDAAPFPEPPMPAQGSQREQSPSASFSTVHTGERRGLYSQTLMC